MAAGPADAPECTCPVQGPGGQRWDEGQRKRLCQAGEGLRRRRGSLLAEPSELDAVQGSDLETGACSRRGVGDQAPAAAFCACHTLRRGSRSPFNSFCGPTCCPSCAAHTRPAHAPAAPPSDSFPGADPQGLRERLPASLCGLGPASPGPTPLPPQTSDPSRGQSPVPLPPLPLGRQPPRGWA